MRKAQLGVEFFLVTAVIIAFMLLLYTVATGETARTRTLDAALLSKTLVDDVSFAANYVTLSGNGSVLHRDVFAGAETNCFFYDSTEKAIYCTLEEEKMREFGVSGRRVFGRRLFAEPLMQCATPLAPGWYRVTTEQYNGATVISCAKLG
ncbi:Uncharacterised protein [Candidatus Norongarragalina meridionalis]|nr:Uncharacterised protein [Candidatus Norongarragalina meridionalis]